MPLEKWFTLINLNTKSQYLYKRKAPYTEDALISLSKDMFNKHRKYIRKRHL